MTEEIHATFTIDIPGSPPGAATGLAGSLINRPCVLVRRDATGATDSRGNPVIETTELDSLCEIQQERREEATDTGVITVTTWRAFFAPGLDIAAGDKVITTDDGRGYEVDGEPWEARNPRTQSLSHIEATLKRTSGLDRDGS